MLEPRPYIAGDVLMLDVQDAQSVELWPQWLQRWRTHRPDGPAWSLWRPDGTLAACGGVVPIWEGRAVAWALIGRVRRAEWGYLIRHARESLARWDFRRIEAAARADFAGAVRVLEHLGFEREGRLRRYGPRGDDYLMYARVS